VCSCNGLHLFFRHIQDPYDYEAALHAVVSCQLPLVVFPVFFCFSALFRKIFVFRLLEYLNAILDPKLGAMSCGAELTRLSATGLGAKLC
jgi:hypothetical protein